MRLNAYLARAGVASRRAADELIKAGRVRVNGRAGRAEHLRRRPATRSRSTAGRSRSRSSRTCSCTSRPGRSRPRATRRAGRPSSALVPAEPRVVPVGRLDADTTGALLLTNDGRLAHRLAHPRYEVDKVYEAEVEGDPGRRRAAPARRGRRARRRPTAPARARRLGPGRIELTIHEGRKHQVKRMCEAVGHPVRRLHRRRYAGLDVRGLAPGEWRELTRTRSLRLPAARRALTTRRTSGSRGSRRSRRARAPRTRTPRRRR